MVDITEQTHLSAPLPEVWSLLSDPKLVAACIPGASLAPNQNDETWKGSMRVRFGPTVATFRGEAKLDYDHANHRCTIEGRGIDQRGASRATSSGVVTASAEGNETRLDVNGSFTVTGPLAHFANAGGVHVARALLAEFAANMAKLVLERRAAQSTAPEAAPAAEPSAAGAAPPPQPTATAPLAAPKPAAELNGFALLWRIVIAWLRALFRRRIN